MYKEEEGEGAGKVNAVGDRVNLAQSNLPNGEIESRKYIIFWDKKKKLRSKERSGRRPIRLHRG